MRPTSLLSLPLLLTLACSGEDSTLAAQHASPRPATRPSSAAPSSTPAPAPEAPVTTPLPPANSDEAPSAETGEVEAASAETGATEAPQPPADALAPLLPEGPEPGSPEADAELEALLEESTITQDEFDQAFRGKGGPNLQGDQFVFGPRTRGEPVLEVGGASGGSEAARAKLEALARAESRKVLGCYTMALDDNPSAAGSVKLRLRVDAKGEVSEASTTGGAGLGEAMKTCLVAIARSWTLAEANDAQLEVELRLHTKS